MQRQFLFTRLLMALLGMALVSVRLSAETPTRDAAEILRRVVEQSNASDVPPPESCYAYTRDTLVMHYNEKGKLKRQVNKVYEVEPEEGQPVMTLVSVNGKQVEPEREEPRGGYSKAGDDAKQLDFNEDLIARYDFTYEKDTIVNGRTLAVLSFRPRAEPLDEGGMFGKLLNQLAGTLWVDLEDDQIARLEVRLLQRVSFFAGIAGALEKMNLNLVRVRVAPGVWLNASSRIDLEGRKLFSPVRFQAFENCSDFRRVTDALPRAAN